MIYIKKFKLYPVGAKSTDIPVGSQFYWDHSNYARGRIRGRKEVREEATQLTDENKTQSQIEVGQIESS
jgi:hypothetical protein